MTNTPVHNNKQNQMPENLHHDTKVEGWALWFCLSPLPPSVRDRQRQNENLKSKPL
jgi:hypothetical protein